jgi:hypothetical protein
MFFLIIVIIFVIGVSVIYGAIAMFWFVLYTCVAIHWCLNALLSRLRLSEETAFTTALIIVGLLLILFIALVNHYIRL